MAVIRWRRAAVVAEKELRDTLRDRRTLLMMVLVPALLYPLGGVALSQLTASAMARLEREGYTVALEGAGAVEGAGKGKEAGRGGSAPTEPPGGEVVRAALRRDPALRLSLAADAAAALRSAKDPAAVALRVHKKEVPLPAGGRGEQVTVEVLYDAASARSRAGLERARRALDAEAAERRRARLQSLQLGEEALQPLALREASISSEGKAALVHLAPAVAILLILLSLMGAFYPAIDLVAGERERGTLEPLLTTPTSRLELVAGKYACLAVLSLATCVLNLGALSLTTGFMLRGATAPLSLSPGQALLLLVATAPVLLLVSALLLLSAVFARSFKDAQNLMTPVYLACIVPALCGLVPGMRLEGGLALVPVLSAVLFIKELLGGTLQLLPAFLSVSSGLVYAAVAVALAARVFDGVLIGAGGARVADHGLSLLTAPAEGPGGRRGDRSLTLTGALGLFGLCLSLMLHVAPRLQLANLRLGLLLTELGLILLPVLLLLRLGGVPLRAGLGLAPLRAPQVLGALLLGVGGAALGLWLFVFITDPLLRPPPEYLRALEALKPRTPADRLVMLAIGAVLPALCEEALCRGALLTAARRTLGAPAAVLLCGFLFAVLHVDPYRFLGTLVLGCLLGVAAVRGGSLLAASLMHLGNNAVAFLVGDALDAQLGQRGPALHGLLAMAAIFFVLGLKLLGRGSSVGGGTPNTSA